MKKMILAALVALFFSLTMNAQMSTDSMSGKKPVDSLTVKKAQDSIQKALKDSIRFARFDSIGVIPLIDGGKYSKVLPVKDIEEVPDKSHPYKLLFELTAYRSTDTAHKEINEGLTEIARIINLHIAAGIPLAKLQLVVIAHGMVYNDLMNDSSFKVKFDKPNPNIKVVNDLMKIGTRFIVCGQAMEFFEFKKEQFIAGIRKALTAKVVISDYVGRGFVRYEIKTE